MKISNVTSLPAVSEAIEFIKRSIAAGQWKDGDLLPPISKLAADCRVSFVSMWKAARELKREGILCGGRGRRMRVGTGGKTFSAPEREPLLWQRKKSLIEQDLIIHRFAPGQTLPSSKQLQQLYGIGYRGLRKILAALIEEKRITPYHRTYKISSLVRCASQSTLVLIGGAEGGGRISVHYQRIQEFMGFFETQCSRSQINLKIMGLRLCEPLGQPPPCQRVQGNLRAPGVCDICRTMVVCTRTIPSTPR
jgi:DNA-binding transcriptional regulator YhcF (GntR family)